MPPAATENRPLAPGAGAPRLARKLAAGALVALVLVPSLALLASPRARAAFRLTSGFAPLGGEPRVLLEAGAEPLASRLAAALPGAIARVEAVHGLPLRSGFLVYVCATHEDFARRLGLPANSPVRGMALFRDVWISPKAFDFAGRDTHRESLAHELAHLHLTQHLGVLGATARLPGWFVEGLADVAADTGNEQVTREQAIEAIRAGRSLEPDATGRPLSPRRAEDYGLSWPMLHRQSRMFVEHLREEDEAAFARFVPELLGGAAFDAAFRRAFGREVGKAWQAFVASLLAEPDGAEPADGEAAR